MATAEELKSTARSAPPARLKWVMFAICLVTIALLGVSVVVLHSRMTVYRQTQDTAAIQSNLKQTAVSLREQFKRLDDFAATLPVDVWGEEGASVDGGYHHALVQSYFRTNTDVAGMTIYTADNRLVNLSNAYSPYTFYAYSGFDASQIRMEANNEGADTLMRRKSVDTVSEYLQFIKIRRGEDGDTVIVIDKNTGPLKSNLQELSLPEQGNLYVLNNLSDVLFYTGTDRSVHVDRLILNAMDQPSGYLQGMRVDGEAQYVFYEKTVLYGCNILYIFPTAYFERVDEPLLLFLVGFFLLGLVCILVVVLVFKRYILDPVSYAGGRLAYLAQDRLHYETQDLQVPDRVPRQMSRDLESVAAKLNRLMQSDISSRTLLKQAELDALQSQISPHFLYNTLETIRGQALTIGATEIERMTKALAELFRYSIIDMGSKVRLQEELKNVDNYLSIQQHRFGERFAVVREVEQDTLNLRVPKLLIQPLVENAFQHGLERTAGNGHIAIRAYMTQYRLIIQVEDDGIGIPEERRRQINEYLKNGRQIELDHKNRIGLSNVNERIKLNYGNEYGIKLYGGPDRGTLVEVDLPLKQPDDWRCV